MVVGEGTLEGVVTPAFWHGRRVFLTGHTGFKGAWTALWLQALGAEVTGYALAPPTDPSLFALARVRERLDHVEADIRDAPRLESALRGASPEIVLHFAAQSLVRRSFREPVATYETNVIGTANLLEAVRRLPSVRVVLVATSDKCYDDFDAPGGGHVETDPLGGRDPYSSSKACAELVTAAYRASFFADAAAPRVASVRAGNVIGGGDFAEDRLVPDIVRALLGARPVEIRNPAAVRPWQHVLDPVAGYLILCERLAADDGALAGPWNFGPDLPDPRPVAYVAERLLAGWDPPGRWVRDDRPHPPEAAKLVLNSAQARSRLGWRPRLALDAALDWTLGWYRAHRAGADLRAETLRQIQTYSVLGAPAR